MRHIKLAGVWLFLVLAFSLHGQDKKPEPANNGITGGNGVTFVTDAMVSPPLMILTKARFDGTIDEKPAFVELDYKNKTQDCDATYSGTFTLQQAREIFETRGAPFYVRLCNQLSAKP